MVKKNFYEAPGFRLVEIRYEEAFLQGSNTGGLPGGDDEIYDYPDDF